jgi:hypothetical protein
MDPPTRVQAHPTGPSSAADLRFLQWFLQNSVRNFKSNSGTRVINLLVPLLLPKFVSVVAAMGHELRKRGTGTAGYRAVWQNNHTE